jgi:hypothetical protein
VGKFVLKSKGNEALSDEFLYLKKMMENNGDRAIYNDSFEKSNGDEVVNAE